MKRSGSDEAAAARASDLAPMLATDNPEAYIARDRRRALAAGMAMPNRVAGSALFADISGFTPLTEALAKELGPQRGAEELTISIGRVFHAVIAQLDAYAGDVIYFAGDAITCWIDGDDGTLACAAAMAMQEAIGRTGTIVTPGGTEVRLAMKVAVAMGDARRFVVGDPEIQLIDVLAGRLMDDLAAAEHSAERGDVILEQSAIERLGDRVTLGERREDHDTGRLHAVLEGLNVPVTRSPVEEPPPLPEDLVRPWLLPPVYERIRAGRGEFLTELRPAIPVFLRFSGIDYDLDEDAAGKLDEFVRGAQNIMSGYGGNVLQLTLGDKGAYLYGVFGSPIAHEDDAARAAAAALELRDLDKTTAAREIQIGITRGMLRSGTYGHAMRRTFVCLGDEVNLSARLMSAAPPGHIYVSERIHVGAGDSFVWDRLPDMKVKGKAQSVAVFALNGSLQRASRRKLRFELRLVGRKREIAALNASLAAALDHRGQVIGLAAEAGMGKSRLVAEFVRSARRRGTFVAFGEFQAFGTNTSYFAWREVWRRLLRLEDDQPVAEQIALLEAELAAIDPSLVPRVPLLAAVVGIEIPDGDLTRGFDPKLRKSSLEDLLGRCLRARAATEPLVIVLEDCHWIDELSRDLLQSLVRATPDLRLLFVLAYRPAEAPGGGLGIERLANFDEISLDRLDEADAAEVVASKLEQVLGHGEPPSKELVELVTERADGNPLYIEEIVSYIAGQAIDPHDKAAMLNLKLPDSLQALVLSRMDAVAEDARRSMKVASVVGRVFEATILPGAYPELGGLDDVLRHLEMLRSADLVGLDREADLAYMFKHVVTQEVAYQSMPFATRSMLHGRVGTYLEARDPDGVDRQLDLLAHHFWLSDDDARKIEFLGRAAAAASAKYANAAAVEYFERLIPLLEGAERVTEMLSLAKVLRLIGRLAETEKLLVDARAIAVELDDVPRQARCDAALAEMLNRLSRYDEALVRLDAALLTFRALGEDAAAAEMLHVAGLIAQHRGDYPTARARYTESRALRERVADWSGVAATDANLAILAEFEGDYQGAFDLNERALALRRKIGDRRGVGIGEMNAGYYGLHLGLVDESKARLDVALAMSREIGDRAMVVHAQRTLADACRNSGEHASAAELYGEALRGYRELGNEFELTFMLEDIGVLLAHATDPRRGFELVGAAEALRAKVGSPRPPSVATELANHLADTRTALGDGEAEAAIERGRAWSLDEAIEAAKVGFDDISQQEAGAR